MSGGGNVHWRREERGGGREERVQEDRKDGGEGEREEGKAGRWGVEGGGGRMKSVRRGGWNEAR